MSSEPATRVSPAAELPSTGLLSFYDRLRERVVEAAERRSGRLGPALVEALLLVPDVFILVARLALDREVPASTRALLGGALAYFVLPADLFPEAILGAGGYIEDLVVAVAVLSHAFGPDVDQYAERYWSGSTQLRQAMTDISRAGRTLLGGSLYGRVERMLARRGIPLPSPATERQPGGPDASAPEASG